MLVCGRKESNKRRGTAYALFQVPSQHTIIRLALNHCPVGLLWAQGTVFSSIVVRSSGYDYEWVCFVEENG